MRLRLTEPNFVQKGKQRLHLGSILVFLAGNHCSLVVALIDFHDAVVWVN